MIKYSIIVCTYNRSSLLKETIDSLIEVLGIRRDYEVLIIDNNSTDSTVDIVKPYLRENIKYFLETNQGLSYSRNRGMIEAAGDIYVFFDDDISIVKDYFEISDRIFERGYVGIAGGKVLPYKVQIPTWLPLKYYYLASIFDLGDASLDVKYLMGANYIVHSAVAKHVGSYNVELGRKGGNLMSGEENDYLDRARKLQYPVFYHPGLVVYHKIDNKLNKKYILQYAFENGKSTAMFIRHQSGFLKFFLKIVKASLIHIEYLFWGIFHHGDLKMLYQIRFNYSQGYVRGAIL